MAAYVKQPRQLPNCRNVHAVLSSRFDHPQSKLGMIESGAAKLGML